MSKNWVITSAAERIVLDGQKRGEASFTVTNSGTASDAMFEVVPLEGAQPAWFTVDSPQRTVATNASVSYVVKVSVPPTAPGGSYALKGRVYSAESASDLAPEETSVDSGRVVLEVPKPEVVPKKPFPWWIIVVIAAVLVVITVAVTVLVVVLRDDQPAAAPVASEVVTVPDLAGKSEVDASDALLAAGLKIGKVVHQHDPAAKGVVTQSVKAGERTLRGSTVDLTVQVQLSRPVLKTPAIGTVLTGTVQAPSYTWEQAEPYVVKWDVVIWSEICYVVKLESPQMCAYGISFNGTGLTSPIQPSLSFVFRPTQGTIGNYHSGHVRWEVFPLDETGKRGPGALFTYQVKP